MVLCLDTWYQMYEVHDIPLYPVNTGADIYLWGYLWDVSHNCSGALAWTRVDWCKTSGEGVLRDIWRQS